MRLQFGVPALVEAAARLPLGLCVPTCGPVRPGGCHERFCEDIEHGVSFPEGVSAIECAGERADIPLRKNARL
jgi:hypothetical protein